MAANSIINGETGLSARTKLNAVLGDSYNVKLYGLVGDGVTDDRNALNTLLNTTAPSGSTIYFPTGNYFIGSNITVVDKQFNLIGSFATISINANTQIFNISSSVTAATKWRVENIIFSGSTVGLNQYAFYFSGNSGSFVINNCTFLNFAGGGIAVVATELNTRLGGLISLCKFYSNNIAINLGFGRSEYIQIIGCDLFLNTIGINIAGGNCLINGNNINYNDTGIESISGINNGHGIISSNNINHNNVYAINIHDTADGMTIADNHLYASTVRIANTSGIVISGGHMDSVSYVYDTNIGLEINGVRFPNSLANTTTLTGAKPRYTNCYHIDGRVVADSTIFYSEKTTFTNDGTYSIPAGYCIDSIVFNNTTANAVTGGIKIGTTNGGTDVIAAQAVAANAFVKVQPAAILISAFSMTASTTLFVQDVSSWNSASVDMYMKLKQVV